MRTRYCDKHIIGAVLLVWLVFAPLAQAYYNPSAGRWLSRDPIEERGGRNLTGFLGNAPVIKIDSKGLSFTWSYNIYYTYDLEDDLTSRFNAPTWADAVTYYKEWLEGAWQADYKTKTCCHPSKNCSATKVYEVSFSAHVGLLFRGSEEEAAHPGIFGLQSPYPGDSLRDHEERHWAVYQSALESYKNLFLSVYDKCVCDSCFGAWQDYLGAVEATMSGLVDYQQNLLDWNSYQNPQAGVDAAAFEFHLDGIRNRLGAAARNMEEKCRGESGVAGYFH